MTKNPSQQEIDDCLEIYLKYNGRKHELIELEMHAKGWADFYRGLLYTRSNKHGVVQGWIEKFNWDLQIPAGKRKGLRQRNFGRNSFFHWLKETTPHFKWNWAYQRFLYERLHSITTGRARRLIILLPPRHGKSEMVTVRYSAWRLEQDPGLNIILASYNQKLVNRFSRKIRNVLRDNAYRRAYSGNTAADTLAVNGGKNKNPAAIARGVDRINTSAEWETLGGGGVRAVGVGGGVTGFGAG